MCVAFCRVGLCGFSRSIRDVTVHLWCNGPLVGEKRGRGTYLHICHVTRDTRNWCFKGVDMCQGSDLRTLGPTSQKGDRGRFHLGRTRPGWPLRAELGDWVRRN
jgi:hypothetical protein